MTKMNVVISTNSIEKTKQMMDSECDKLLGMIKKYQDMFEETKTIYDTESAMIFRKIANAYLELLNNYVNSNLKTYISSLDEINKLYLSEINATTKEIKGGAS